MCYAPVPVCIIPAHGKLHTAVCQGTAYGYHNLCLGVDPGRIFRFSRPFPEHQHILGDGQAGIPDDQLVKFIGELPVDLSGAIALDIFPDLEGFRQIPAGLVRGVGLAVLGTAGISKVSGCTVIWADASHLQWMPKMPKQS